MAKKGSRSSSGSSKGPRGNSRATASKGKTGSTSAAAKTASTPAKKASRTPARKAGATSAKKAGSGSTKKAASTTSKKAGTSASKKTTRKKAAKKTTKASKSAAAAKAETTTTERTKKKVSRTRKKAGSKNEPVASPAALLLDHTTEDLLAFQVLDEVEIGPGIEIAALDLKIRDGNATVRGSVCDRGELEALEQTIREAGGLKDLSSQVQVSSTRVEEDRDRARKLHEALESAPGLSEEAIQVACVGPRVILRGSIGSEALKATAALFALRAGDATRISNRLVAMDHSGS